MLNNKCLFVGFCVMDDFLEWVIVYIVRVIIIYIFFLENEVILIFFVIYVLIFILYFLISSFISNIV